MLTQPRISTSSISTPKGLLAVCKRPTGPYIDAEGVLAYLQSIQSGDSVCATLWVIRVVLYYVCKCYLKRDPSSDDSSRRDEKDIIEALLNLKLKDGEKTLLDPRVNSNFDSIITMLERYPSSVHKQVILKIFREHGINVPQEKKEFLTDDDNGKLLEILLLIIVVSVIAGIVVGGAIFGMGLPVGLACFIGTLVIGAAILTGAGSSSLGIVAAEIVKCFSKSEDTFPSRPPVSEEVSKEQVHNSESSSKNQQGQSNGGSTGEPTINSQKTDGKEESQGQGQSLTSMT